MALVNYFSSNIKMQNYVGRDFDRLISVQIQKGFSNVNVRVMHILVFMSLAFFTQMETIIFFFFCTFLFLFFTARFEPSCYKYTDTVLRNIALTEYSIILI